MGMEIARIERTQLAHRVVESLGLDPQTARLDSSTAIAASVRRAASFLCPTPPAALVREVNDALFGLTESPLQEIRDAIYSAVNALVALGDLVELPLEDSGGLSRRHLFLGPPSYVPQASRCIVLGVRPEGAPILSEGMLGRIEYDGEVRFIRRREESEDLEELLAGEGLFGLGLEHWLKAPRRASPGDLVEEYIARLDAAGDSGDIEGIRMIDPSSDVVYYRGRWRAPKQDDDGRFVARRPQAYGADLWCFAEVRDGRVGKLIDLPIASPIARGADEAWRLQAAIDRLSGNPQRLRIRRLPGQAPIVDVFSPLPSWHQRRLEYNAARADRSGGALFSYSLAADDVAEEVRYLTEMLWLESEEAGGSDHGSR
jgi:hypothetical protein